MLFFYFNYLFPLKLTLFYAILHVMTNLPEELITAYKNTRYFVQQHPNEWVIKINEFNSDFNTHLEANKVEEWAFITAYNPYSNKLSINENNELQQVLKQKLQHNNFKYWEGYGQGEGEWPAEPSVLVLNISKEYAMQLAKNFKQNAFCTEK